MSAQLPTLDARPVPPGPAVEAMLRRCPDRSDRAIASATGTTARVVAAARARGRGVDAGAIRIGRDGRARPLSTAEGRRAAAEFLRSHPGASLRSVAQVAGISVGTARDVRNRIERGEPPELPARNGRAGHDRPRDAAGHVQPRDASGVPRASTAELVVRLSNDPSICYAAAGRTLIRMLVLHRTFFQERAAIAEVVPGHCAPHVARVARECSGLWLDLAERLDRRHRPDGG